MPRAISGSWLAGGIGFDGNWIAAQVRTRAGRRLESAVVVALGLELADPIIGLGITLVILRITWQSWQMVREGRRHSHPSDDSLTR